MASGQGQLQYSEFIPVAVTTPPNWKPCEGKYGTASGDLDIERVSSFPKGRRLCDGGAGLNFTTCKVYKSVEGRAVETTTGTPDDVLVGNSGNIEDGMVNWVIRDESNGNSSDVETGLRLFDLDLNGVTEDLDSVVMNGVDNDGNG